MYNPDYETRDGKRKALSYQAIINAQDGNEQIQGSIAYRKKMECYEEAFARATYLFNTKSWGDQLGPKVASKVIGGYTAGATPQSTAPHALYIVDLSGNVVEKLRYEGHDKPPKKRGKKEGTPSKLEQSLSSVVESQSPSDPLSNLNVNDTLNEEHSDGEEDEDED